MVVLLVSRTVTQLEEGEVAGNGNLLQSFGEKSNGIVGFLKLFLQSCNPFVLDLVAVGLLTVVIGLLIAFDNNLCVVWFASNLDFRDFLSHFAGMISCSMVCTVTLQTFDSGTFDKLGWVRFVTFPECSNALDAITLVFDGSVDSHES